MEQVWALVESASRLTVSDWLAVVTIVATLAVLLPFFKALNDALRDALYKMVSTQVARASVSLTGVEVSLESLKDIDTNSADPEYLTLVESKIEDLKKSIEVSVLEAERKQLNTVTTTWREVLVSSRERLIDETDRLQARSQANLLFGATTSFFGIILLIFLLFLFPPSVPNGTWQEALVQYGPRFALVIIVQLIGTFFFRMYVSNETDIKLNKNEITNIELRYASALMAEGNKSAAAKVADYFAKEERNFVLKRGERSVGEAQAANVENSLNILEKITKSTAGSPK